MKHLRAATGLACFVGLLLIVTAAANAAIRFFMPRLQGDMAALVREVEDLVIVVVVTGAVTRFDSRSLADVGFPPSRAFRREFWLGAVVGLVAVTVLMATLHFIGAVGIDAVALRASNVALWALGWAVVFTIVGLREELRTRGYIFATIASSVGFWPAALVTSALFAYSHSANPGENAIGLANVFLFGLGASLWLRATGNLWFPIGLHMCFDWAETYFYGALNSGHALPGHLLSAYPTGPSWLSGGTVGPEGSVLCSVLFVMLCVCAAVAPRTLKKHFLPGRRGGDAMPSFASGG